jgi:RNA polymerase sigma-70 factor (ECF subfamily)
MDVVQGPNNNREELLNHMVWQYEKDLLLICCAYLRDAALAQDAVQETLLRAYKSLSAFREDCSDKTWLMHIAMNVCKNFRRNTWYRFVDRRVSLEHLSIPSTPPSLEQISLATEIVKLPRKHMDVVLLYYYQDLNTKEIAQVLGITPAAISNRLIKARSRLRVALRGDDGNER